MEQKPPARRDSAGARIRPWYARLPTDPQAMIRISLVLTCLGVFVAVHLSEEGEKTIDVGDVAVNCSLTLPFPKDFFPAHSEVQTFELEPLSTSTVVSTTSLTVLGGEPAHAVLARSVDPGEGGVRVLLEGRPLGRLTWRATGQAPELGSGSESALLIDFDPPEAPFDKKLGRWTTACRIGLIKAQKREAPGDNLNPTMLRATEKIEIELRLYEGGGRTVRTDNITIKKGECYSDYVPFGLLHPEWSFVEARSIGVNGDRATPKCIRTVSGLFVSADPLASLADGHSGIVVQVFPRDEANLPLRRIEWRQTPTSPLAINVPGVASSGARGVSLADEGLEWTITATSPQRVTIAPSWGQASVSGCGVVEFVPRSSLHVPLLLGGACSSALLLLVVMYLVFRGSGIPIRIRRWLYLALVLVGAISGLCWGEVGRVYVGDFWGVFVVGMKGGIGGPAIALAVESAVKLFEKK